MSVATDLDHVGVGVRDLAAAAATYERLGFTLSPYARHAGAVEPGGPTLKRATGNRCAMLGHGYIELIAVVDPALPAGGLDRRIAEREGVHILALGCDDAGAADAALKRAGFAARGSVYLERMVDTPEGPRLAKFDRVPVAPEETPEGVVFYIKHLTRAAIWQPQLLGHANGAVELAQAFVHVADLGEAVARYRRFLGLDPAQTGPGRADFDLPRGRLSFLDATGLERALPAAMAPPAPAIAGILVRTASMEAARRALDQAGVAALADGARLWVPPERAHGCVIGFSA